MKKIYLSGQADGEAWILTIRDEGVGIPPYDLERVFEPFFTGENGAKVSGFLRDWFIYMWKNCQRTRAHDCNTVTSGQRNRNIDSLPYEIVRYF